MKRGHVMLKFFLSLSFLCVSCNMEQKEEEPVKAQIFAMDTIMDLTVYGSKGEEAIVAAKKKIQELDKLFSVNKPAGDIAKINANSGRPQSVTSDTYNLVRKSLVISEKTEGVFDISIYPVVKAWGFTEDNYRVPAEAQRKKLSKKVDYKKIHCENGQVLIEDGMELDLGGIAKGYTSGCIMEVFRETGVDSAIVSLGGNVETMGRKPDGSRYKVGIKNPLKPETLLGTIEVENKAVVTSGSYERFFEKDGEVYHHIMDKRTGAPAKSDLVSVTVVADDGTTADALSTALFILGSERAIEMQKEACDFEMVLVKEEGEVYVSENLDKEFKRVN